MAIGSLDILSVRDYEVETKLSSQENSKVLQPDGEFKVGYNAETQQLIDIMNSYSAKRINKLSQRFADEIFTHQAKYGSESAHRIRKVMRNVPVALKEDKRLELRLNGSAL